MSRDPWHLVGGYSTEFSPDMGSNDDFSIKLWHAGCRTFLGVGDNLFYHFAKAPTARVCKNGGRRQFLMKWGMSPSTFDRHCPRRGEAPLPGAGGLVLQDPQTTWRWRLQEFKSALKRRLG